MHVAVHGASHDTLTLAWADTHTGAPPEVYVDDERRTCTAVGAHLVVPGLVPGVAYTLHVADGAAPAVYLTHPSRAAPPTQPVDTHAEGDARQLQHEIETLRTERDRRDAQRAQAEQWQAFADAARLGLGWGMIPQAMIRPGLVPLAALPLDIPLYWHVQRALKPALSPLTAAIRKRAAAELRP